jgi:hypothetical protein
MSLATWIRWKRRFAPASVIAIAQPPPQHLATTSLLAKHPARELR